MLNLKDKLKFMMYMRDDKKSPIYLEYLESDGGQWIDTRYKPNIKETQVNFTFETLNSIYDTYALIGARDFNAFNKLNFNIFVQDGKFRFDCTGVHSYFKYCSTNTKYKISFIDNKIAINDVWNNIGTSKDNVTLNSSIFLFNQSNQQMPYKPSLPQKLYSCQIYDNGVLVRNFRPCLNPDTLQPAMYDTVNEEYFYNQGTGEFKYELSFTTLDYIESDGNQWIDTEKELNEKSRVLFDFKLNSIQPSNSIAIFGARENHLTNKFYLFRSSNLNFYSDYGNGAVEGAINIPITVNKKYTVDKNRGKTYINGQETASKKDTAFVTGSNSAIFHLINAPESWQNAIGCIYKYSLYDDDILIQDLIPVRKNDGTICMYDFISAEYYYNQGTGKFKGYVNGYQVGNSIHAVGPGHYINTNIIPEETLKSYSYASNFNAGHWLFGSRISASSGSAIGIFKSDNFLAVAGFGTAATGVGIDMSKTQNSLPSKIIIEKNKLTVDKNSVALPNFLSFNQAKEITLFAMNQGELDSRWYNGKYHTQIFLSTKKENNLYLLPVKKENFIGMLDVLTGEEYPNMGSGEFIFNE